MPVRLCRWGNSTGLRIPKAVMEAAGLKPGRTVSLRVLDSGDIRVRPLGAAQPADDDVAAQEVEVGDSLSNW